MHVQPSSLSPHHILTSTILSLLYFRHDKSFEKIRYQQLSKHLTQTFWPPQIICLSNAIISQGVIVICQKSMREESNYIPAICKSSALLCWRTVVERWEDLCGQFVCLAALQQIFVGRVRSTGPTLMSSVLWA